MCHDRVKTVLMDNMENPYSFRRLIHCSELSGNCPISLEPSPQWSSEVKSGIRHDRAFDAQTRQLHADAGDRRRGGRAGKGASA